MALRADDGESACVAGPLDPGPRSVRAKEPSLHSAGTRGLRVPDKRPRACPRAKIRDPRAKLMLALYERAGFRCSAAWRRAAPPLPAAAAAHAWLSSAPAPLQ